MSAFKLPLQVNKSLSKPAPSHIDVSFCKYGEHFNFQKMTDKLNLAIVFGVK